MEWIKRVVHELKDKYRTSDPYELGSNENIHIINWNLHPEIHGFYKYIRRNKYIFLNNNLSAHMKRFVCAHELGHATLHPRSNTPFLRANTLFSIDKIEVEANTFAVELLIPNKAFYAHQEQSMTDKELAATYGVPCEVVHLKKMY